MATQDPKQLRKAAHRFHSLGKPVPALEKLDQLIQLKLADHDDWRLTGNILAEVGEFAQAIDAYQHCLELAPDDLNARYELGRAFYKLGESDQAAESIEYVAVETGSPEVWLGLSSLAPGVPSFSNEKIGQVRKRYARMVRQAEGVSATRPRPPMQHGRLDEERGPLKVGFLSAHFANANYMKPVWPLINLHDVETHELHLFNDAEVTQRSWAWLTSEKAVRHEVANDSNRQLAERIRQAQVDVLIDLSAYSEPQRLGVFVHRPAPIQVAWFNSFATNGLEEIDYIIGDPFVLPETEQEFYSESFLALPLSYLTFQTNHAAPPVAPSPFGETGKFSFGSLGTQYKITRPVVDAWSSILRQAPQATLVLANRELRSSCNREYILAQFQSRGIAAERIQVLPPAEHFEFLKYYDQIDLALDTFPYNGGTTTMESLWQGVPTLTFNGDRWASRTSRSIIRHTHIPEFDRDNLDDYIQTAVRYATDSKRQDDLKRIRESMRGELSQSTACDSQQLADSMVALYEAMLLGGNR